MNFDEKSYIEGRNAAYRQIMLQCVRELAIFDEESVLPKLARLIDERARAVRALREICEKLDCNDWPDNLDLGDIIEKNLARAIDARIVGKP